MNEVEKDMNEAEKYQSFLKNLDMLHKAPEGFASEIMKKIHAKEQVQDEALRALLTKYAYVQPKAEFTHVVMQNLTIAKKAVSASVIGKKAWTVIALVIGLVVVLVMTSNPSANPALSLPEGLIPEWNLSLSFELPAFFKNPMFIWSVLALSSLFILDYFLRERKQVLSNLA